MASLGLILASGVTGILISALIVLPALLNVFLKKELAQKSSASEAEEDYTEAMTA